MASLRAGPPYEVLLYVDACEWCPDIRGTGPPEDRMSPFLHSGAVGALGCGAT